MRRGREMFSKIKSLWYILVPNDLVFFGGFFFRLLAAGDFFRGFHWFFSWPAADDFFFFYIGFSELLVAIDFCSGFHRFLNFFQLAGRRRFFGGRFHWLFRLPAAGNIFMWFSMALQMAHRDRFFSVVFIGFFKFPASGDFFKNFHRAFKFPAAGELLLWFS